MSDDKFREFVKGLSEDPQKLDEFQKDPEGTMDAAELSSAEKVLIRHGNQELILEALGGGGASAAIFIVRIFRFGV